MLSKYEMSEPLLVSEYEKTREEILIKVAESEAVATMCDGWRNIRHAPIINFLLVCLSLCFGNRFILRCKAILENM